MRANCQLKKSYQLGIPQIGGTIGSFSLMAWTGACSGICSASSLPLAAILGSMGFATASRLFLYAHTPLVLLTGICGFMALKKLICNNQTIGGVVFATFLGAALTYGIGGIFTGTRTSSVPYSTLNPESIEPKPDQRVLATDKKLFRDQFNRDSDKLRVVTLLSPTCGGCVRGHESFASIFKNVSSPSIKGYVIWLPMMRTDSFDFAKSLAWSINEPRIMDFWDKDRSVGIAFTGTLGLDRTAWDVYVIYPPGAIWEEDRPPPKPIYWMHQLWGLPKDNFLDGNRLRAKVSELVPNSLM